MSDRRFVVTDRNITQDKDNKNTQPPAIYKTDTQDYENNSSSSYTNTPEKSKGSVKIGKVIFALVDIGFAIYCFYGASKAIEYNSLVSRYGMSGFFEDKTFDVIWMGGLGIGLLIGAIWALATCRSSDD